MYKEILATFPEYMNKFICIGAKCTDSCCIGWRIHVDKKTYKYYKNNRNKSEFNKILNSRVKTLDNGLESSYAYIELKESGRCSFLDDDNLCAIYKNIGHDSLSAVCCTYPREYHQINDRRLIYAHLSCPELARIALLDKDGIKLVTEKIKVHEKLETIKVSNSGTGQDNLFTTKYFFEILETTLFIIQNRSFSIEKRLMIAGILVSKLSEANENEVEGILNSFKDSELLETYNKQLRNIESKFYTQLSAIISPENNNEQENEDNLKSKYMLYRELALSNIFQNMERDEQIVDNYVFKGLLAYKRFLKTKSYIIENYIVNTLLERMYPNGVVQIDSSINNIFDCYFKVIVEFIMLRTIIAGILIKEQIDDELMVDIIQTHSKTMVHNSTNIKSYVDALKKENLYSLAGSLLVINI